jgi:hypothetical protein
MVFLNCMSSKKNKKIFFGPEKTYDKRIVFPQQNNTYGSHSIRNETDITLMTCRFYFLLSFFTLKVSS